MSKKILIIEDDVFLAKVYGAKLRDKGMTIIILNDGMDALKITEEESPHLILLDIIMPKKDGFEVLKELSSSAKAKNIPVLVLSQLEQQEDTQKYAALGAEIFLSKGAVDFSEVIEKIELILK